MKAAAILLLLSLAQLAWAQNDIDEGSGSTAGPADSNTTPPQTETQRKLALVRELMKVREEEWRKSKPATPITRAEIILLGLLEVASFARVTNTLASGISIQSGPPPKIINNAFELMKDLDEAEKAIADTWAVLDKAPNPNGLGMSAINGTTHRVGGRGDTPVFIRRVSGAVSRGIATATLQVRKEYRCLTYSERRRYHRAINKLKKTAIGDTNVFDTFANRHTFETAPAAHFGPHFLPWHRQFLFLYQEALTQADPKVVLPYWDSTIDERMQNPNSSAIWGSTYLGSRDGVMRRGPFRRWRDHRGEQLFRGVTGDGFLLFNNEMLTDLMVPTSYIDFHEDYENMHGGPHIYVGGQMEQLPNSPNDPIFFMHHAFVDCAWEEWRNTRQNSTGVHPVQDYPPDEDVEEAFGATHLLDARMFPFEVTARHGLGFTYTNLYYRCHPRGSCPTDRRHGYLRQWERGSTTRSSAAVGGRIAGGVPTQPASSAATTSDIPTTTRARGGSLGGFFGLMGKK